MFSSALNVAAAMKWRRQAAKAAPRAGWPGRAPPPHCAGSGEDVRLLMVRNPEQRDSSSRGRAGQRNVGELDGGVVSETLHVDQAGVGDAHQREGRHPVFQDGV